jgi:hypothetical protein
MLDNERDVETGDDAMAKKSADLRIVDAYVRKLRSVGLDRAAFDSLLLALKGDKDIRVAEAIGIASQYAGRQFGSKKDALEGLAKRFVEMVRTQAQSRMNASERIM